jgi:L-ribulose-5-phosphate 3-epimerase
MNDRRTFLMSLAALAAAGSSSALAGHARPQFPRAPGGIRKSTLISMLPNGGSYADRFALALECGFEGIEMHTMPREEEAAEIRDAAAKTGLKIHSVMNQDHWRLPLSSGDAEVVNGSVRGMETSLRNAALWGADAVLLVPAVVNEQTSYKDAWTRSQRVIRERLLPLAAELKIVIAVEEVWNKFLLSPLEFARYVDELESPWVRAYFDVGNVVLFGYPQDWIRTLGSRIMKLHVKDFRLDGRNRRYDWVNVGEGDIDWPEVRRALTEIKYSGYMTTELRRGDAAYLKDLSARLDRFLAGDPPVPKTA